MRRPFCFRISEEYQTACTVPCGTSGLKSQRSDAGPEIISRLSYRLPSRWYSPSPGSITFTPSTLKEYPQSCSPRGATGTDQMPASSLVIWIFLPLSQLPFRRTSPALGARKRNVTLLSGRISGDTRSEERRVGEECR